MLQRQIVITLDGTPTPAFVPDMPTETGTPEEAFRADVAGAVSSFIGAHYGLSKFDGTIEVAWLTDSDQVIREET